jgi:hypothetical protein
MRQDDAIRYAAFSSAVSEMLASILGEVRVVRQMLDERSVFSHKEYKAEMRLFARQGWPTLVSEVHDRLVRLADEKESKLRKIRSGPLN